MHQHMELFYGLYCTRNALWLLMELLDDDAPNEDIAVLVQEGLIRVEGNRLELTDLARDLHAAEDTLFTELHIIQTLKQYAQATYPGRDFSSLDPKTLIQQIHAAQTEGDAS